MIVLMVLVCSSFMGKSIAIKKPAPPISRLDSLQGNWVSIGDSLNRVSIKNRLFTETYYYTVVPQVMIVLQFTFQIHLLMLIIYHHLMI